MLNGSASTGGRKPKIHRHRCRFIRIQILGKAISNNSLNFPPEQPLTNTEHLGPVTHVIVGDEAFPLQKNIIRPFP